MQKLFLLIALLGISLLITLNLISPYIPLSSQEELKSLQNNQKVLIQGKVIKEYQNENSKTLILNNSLSIQLKSSSSLSFLNKQIEAKGKVSIYQDKTTINALEIKIIG